VRGQVEAVHPEDLANTFEGLTGREEERVAGFVALAGEELEPFACGAQVRRFLPRELPTLYSTGPEAALRRAADRSREVTGDGAWGEVLGDLAAGWAPARAQLVFNYANPLVRTLARQSDAELQRRCVRLLYVQALLLGHHPLSPREMQVMGDGLLGLIARGLTPTEDEPT
jgi:molecular chaperone HtpG